MLQHRVRARAWWRAVSWLGIALVLVALYLAIKVAGFVLKLLLWGLVLFGLYWFLAPHLGWPSVF